MKRNKKKLSSHSAIEVGSFTDESNNLIRVQAICDVFFLDSFWSTHACFFANLLLVL